MGFYDIKKILLKNLDFSLLKKRRQQTPTFMAGNSDFHGIKVGLSLRQSLSPMPVLLEGELIKVSGRTI